jgi:hypothetical protein
MIKFIFQKIIYNGIAGYFATRYIDGVYSGKQFGKSKKQARDQFNQKEII